MPPPQPRVLGAEVKNYDGIVFSPDASLLAAGDIFQPLVWLWDVKTGSALKPLSMGYGVNRFVRFSDDGKTLLTSDWDNITRFWNVALRKEIMAIANIRPAQTSLCVSPHGNALALLTSWASRSDGNVELFTLPSLADIDAMEQTRQLDIGKLERKLETANDSCCANSRKTEQARGYAVWFSKLPVTVAADSRESTRPHR